MSAGLATGWHSHEVADGHGGTREIRQPRHRNRVRRLGRADLHGHRHRRGHRSRGRGEGGGSQHLRRPQSHPCHARPVHVDEENPDDCVWTGTVEYTRPENERHTPETGDSSFSFDTGGGTQHITQSLETVGSYAASGNAPDFGGAIGVTHDNVEGVDIIVPVYSFAETHYLDDEVVTNAYKGKLFHLTGKVCNASFKGLDAGECLFLGVSGSQRGSGADWEISFRFAGSENKTNLTVGGITGINKKGWEYLWVRYQDVTEDSPGLVAPMVVKQPIAVYVEKVYENGNFADLGIGT